MDTLRANGVAFLVMLASLPLIVIGSGDGPDAAWIAGLAALFLALVVPTATRWLGEDDGEDDA